MLGTLHCVVGSLQSCKPSLARQPAIHAALLVLAVLTESGTGRATLPLQSTRGGSFVQHCNRMIGCFVTARPARRVPPSGEHSSPTSRLLCSRDRRVARDRPVRACDLRPFRASGFDASTKHAVGCVSRWSTDTKPACVLVARVGRVAARCWLGLRRKRALASRPEDAREGASERAGDG
ncbi:hypothetical protein SAMN05421858_3542 [Haladaptatus litoreus]|uniref:Uncharacterized protein n=1 Tax=Haladaptatus litoreus TaxID=553468 RepID=A0A1N7DE09_9EURY|nr:hypothetical protein SAMN05421858_3542 [Haladaptatus litoreus]